MSSESATTPSAAEVAAADQLRAANPTFKVKALGFLVWLIATIIARTQRMKLEGYESVLETLKQHNGGILVGWHGRTLILAHLFGYRGHWALISYSKDGDIQNQVFTRFGYKTLRGSTGRGGVKAALQLAKYIKAGGVLAFTPDGPRGPSRVVQGGTVMIAERSGKPIIPLGIAARPCRYLSTWDRYMIPFPFGRAAFVAGDPILITGDLNDEGREAICKQVGDAIDACEARAESLLA